MPLPLTAIPDLGFKSFLGFPVETDLSRLTADIAIIGIPYGEPYNMAGVSGHAAAAPSAIREAMSRYGSWLDHYDFDLDGPLLDGKEIAIVDCGDVPGDPSDLAGNSERATSAVRAILDRGALPVVMGGDDAVPIPVFRAFENRENFTLVQIDAHIDWREEIGGVAEGYSSTVRRASEMDCVDDIYQIGMRAAGSARQQEVDDALAYGATIIKSRTVHANGARWVLDQIPDGGNYYITIDCDAFDPSVMPAVGAPAPGGLTFIQVADIIQGLAGKGRVAGFNIVELVPGLDHNQICALTAGRLITNLIGSLVRSGQVGGG